MNRRKLIGIVASVAVALVGTLLLVSYAGSSKSGTAAAPVELNVDMVVAKEDIPAGATGDLLTSKVEVRQVPQSKFDPRAVTRVEDLAGQIVRTGIIADTAVLTNALTSEPAAVALAVGTPGSTQWSDDLIEITVELPMVRALRGSINVGDRVVIYASFVPRSAVAAGDAGLFAPEELGVTHTLAYDVPVSLCEIAAGVPCSSLALPVTTVAGAAPPVASVNVTLNLMVTPEAAEKIVFSAIRGELWLGRHPRSANPSYNIPAEATTAGNVFVDPPSVNPTEGSAFALTDGATTTTPATTRPASTPSTTPGATPASVPPGRTATTVAGGGPATEPNEVLDLGPAPATTPPQS